MQFPRIGQSVHLEDVPSARGRKHPLADTIAPWFKVTSAGRIEIRAPSRAHGQQLQSLRGQAEPTRSA
jgi:hypothetical protein